MLSQARLASRDRRLQGAENHAIGAHGRAYARLGTSMEHDGHDGPRRSMTDNLADTLQRGCAFVVRRDHRVPSCPSCYRSWIATSGDVWPNGAKDGSVDAPSRHRPPTLRSMRRHLPVLAAILACASALPAQDSRDLAVGAHVR